MILTVHYPNIPFYSILFYFMILMMRTAHGHTAAVTRVRRRPWQATSMPSVSGSSAAVRSSTRMAHTGKAATSHIPKAGWGAAAAGVARVAAVAVWSAPRPAVSSQPASTTAPHGGCRRRQKSIATTTMLWPRGLSAETKAAIEGAKATGKKENLCCTAARRLPGAWRPRRSPAHSKSAYGSIQM